MIVRDDRETELRLDLRQTRTALAEEPCCNASGDHDTLRSMGDP